MNMKMSYTKKDFERPKRNIHKEIRKALQEQQKQELKVKNNKHWFANLTEIEISNEIIIALPHTKEEFSYSQIYSRWRRLHKNHKR